MEKEVDSNQKDAQVVVVNQTTENQEINIEYIDIPSDEYATRDESEFDWSTL